MGEVRQDAQQQAPKAATEPSVCRSESGLSNIYKPPHEDRQQFAVLHTRAGPKYLDIQTGIQFSILIMKYSFSFIHFPSCFILVRVAGVLEFSHFNIKICNIWPRTKYTFKN